MNCMEFRRVALAKPYHPGQEALAHEAGCAACARFYRELRQQEEALYEAMNIAVPEGLAERVFLASRGNWRGRLARFALPALAAGLMAAAVLGMAWMRQPEPLEPEILAAGIAVHVAGERKALEAQQIVPAANLSAAVRRSGGEMRQAPGRATYADHCRLPGGGVGEHLVFDTPAGKLTLILMPDKPITHPVRVERDGLAVSLLAAGRGSLALVSDDRDRIGEAEAWAKTHLRWPQNGA